MLCCYLLTTAAGCLPCLCMQLVGGNWCMTPPPPGSQFAVCMLCRDREFILTAIIMQLVQWAAGLLGVRVGEAPNPGPPDSHQSTGRIFYQQGKGAVLWGTTHNLDCKLAWALLTLRTEITKTLNKRSTPQGWNPDWRC
eukprot:gene10757-biopygen9362